jgi:bleomycin hydrolase
MEIDNTFYDEASEDFNSNEKNKLARNAVTTTNLEDIIVNRELIQKHNRIFSNYIKIKTQPSNQRRSGRCWLFALCNMLRLKMIKAYKLPEPSDFEFSQSYLFFYDIIEKSNFFLNQICKFSDEEVNSRMNNILLSDPVSDGGNWNMILNLINKYGIVPKTSFDESFTSENTYNLNFFLCNKLRDYAFALRNMTPKERPRFIEKCMKEVYKIAVIFMGEPPKKITWQFISKNKFYITKSVTPLEFYKKFVPVNLNDYVLLADNPMQKYYTNFTVNDFNNMKNGLEINYVNVPCDEIKHSVQMALDNEESLWFGCDVGKYLEKSKGILDIDMINYKNVFDTDISLNKKYRLLYLTSDITHAMLLRGYDNQVSHVGCSKPEEKNKKIKKSRKSKKSKQRGGAKKKVKVKKTTKIPCQVKSNNPVSKYLVENSWGKGDYDENIVMTDKYFNEYCYIVAVPKKFVSKKILGISNKKPKRLNLWDPFGYLLF